MRSLPPAPSGFLSETSSSLLISPSLPHPVFGWGRVPDGLEGVKAESRLSATFLCALWHLYDLRLLPQNEEGCHSASFRTTIHCRHHLLFYKDGGFEASLPMREYLREISITWNYSGVNSTKWTSCHSNYRQPGFSPPAGSIHKTIPKAFLEWSTSITPPLRTFSFDLANGSDPRFLG